VPAWRPIGKFIRVKRARVKNFKLRIDVSGQFARGEADLCPEVLISIMHYFGISERKHVAGSIPGEVP
jgi:hypothetical protein